MWKKPIKIKTLIFALVLLALVTPFILWKVMPRKSLQIVVLNKTFPIMTSVKGKITELDYSKQRGLFWLMDQLGIKNPNTNKLYDVARDYYGNFISSGKLKELPLNKLTKVPDIIYIADTYGTGNSKINGKEPKGISGLTNDEVGLIATAQAKGTTVIGEYNIAQNPTKASVASELSDIFGVNFTGWAGKFFPDLSSKEDVPNWIRTIYEVQYGRKWNMTGSGIVIAGNNRIIILKRGKDFKGNSINLSMDRAKGFNTKVIDYYNWFEIVKPKDDKSVIAWYDINLTTDGIKQMKLFGLGDKFAAIIMNKSSIKKSYYFAGDFCDYRETAKAYSFLGAANLYRMFSISSEGDSSYFYWNFYVPFMSKVLKEIKPLDKNIIFKSNAGITKKGTRLVSKVSSKYLSVYQNGTWKKMYVKGVDIGTSLPGFAKGSFPSDNIIYTQWLQKIGKMNVNCIRVYTIMPCGFYRALDIYNSLNPNKKLFLLQNISLKDQKENENFLSKDYRKAYQKATEDTINAIHGNTSIKINDGQDSDLYINDVSGYVLGYLVDPGLNTTNVLATNKANSLYKYNGVYVSSGINATPTESWLASVSDEIYQYEQKKYNMQHPVAITSIPELDTLHHDKSGTNGDDDVTCVDINNIDISSKVKCGFFGAYNIFPDHPGFMTGEDDDLKPRYAGYKEYMDSFIKTQKKYPVLVSEFGIPTSMGANQIGGLEYPNGKNGEVIQGQGIASMMNIIKDSGCMGGLVYEWADEWGRSGPATSSLMIPYERSNLWHNMIEPAQNYGILALESPVPKDYPTSMQAAKPLQSIAYTADESYLYIKSSFNKLPDFNKKSLMIYLNTIDKRKGEHMLTPYINENWSGVEYEINMQNKNKADLLVIPTYNSSKGSYYTSVSISGVFEKMTRQISIANKTKSGKVIAAKYEDQSILVPGNFDDNINNFYFKGNTLYIRIPWARLNVTDPSSLLVLDDKRNKAVVNNAIDKLVVRVTEGIVGSIIIKDKITKKIDYHFPKNISDSGNRTFTWSTWEKPNYVSRNKKSYDIIKTLFAH